MEPLERKIAEIAAPVAEGLGYELVRVKIFGGRRKTVQVMAERPSRAFSIEDCEALSRALSAVMEVEDPIAGEYVLEVSSPGLDRPLTREKDFADFAGSEAKIEMRRMIDGRKRFRGALEGLDGDDVLLRLEGEDAVRRLPFREIETAKLVITDEMLKRELARAKEEEANG
ncbi:MAG: ribosome maturation factor RimP [Parvularculaceae bacterium]